MPPTKPILPVLEALAASRPTRNEPSPSLNSTDCTLGLSTTASTMTNCVLGNSAATFSMALAWLKPMATMGVMPSLANLRIACSRWASFWISKSRNAMPVSFLNFSAPLKAPSLKLLSNLPPMS